MISKRDTVPFLVQLRGTGASISVLYGLETRGDVRLSPRLLRESQTRSAAPEITITIRRQVIVRINGFDLARSYTIGTSLIRPVPPGYSPPGMDIDLLTVDYEGEIQLSPDLTVGGFDIGVLRVSVSCL